MCEWDLWNSLRRAAAQAHIFGCCGVALLANADSVEYVESTETMKYRIHPLAALSVCPGLPFEIDYSIVEQQAGTQGGLP